MAERYKVRNWEKYQHYKKRNPPWIKLHFELLASKDWVVLSDASRVLAIASMLLASKNEGYIPADKDYIKRVAYLNTEPDFTELLECGFLICERNASKTLASASVSVSVSDSFSEGGVGETFATDNIFQDLPKQLDTEEFRVSWRKWENYYRSMKGKAYQPLQRSPAWQSILNEFKGYPLPESAVQAILRAMAGGWVTYYPPKADKTETVVKPYEIVKTKDQLKYEATLERLRLQEEAKKNAS